MGSADVRSVLAAHRPEYRVDTVRVLGEGQDNVAYAVNDELIVRFAKGDTDVAAEARLLRTVAEFTPLPVPTPRLVVPERGCLAYDLLPGTPLIEVPERADQVIHALRGFLDALHAIPVEVMAELVDVDDQDGDGWLTDARDCYAELDVPAHLRPHIERFLDQPPPPADYDLVFSHNDLGVEHVLVDDHRVTGIIDWTDAALCDPAFDHGLIYRDLGVLPDDPTLVDRAVFYARCSVLEDWVYAVETGKGTYFDKTIESLTWLFPVA